MTVYSQLISIILRDYGDNWFTARELAQLHGYNYNSVRRYLLDLAESGYLEVQRSGRQTFYKLKNPHKLAELEEELTQKELPRIFAQQFRSLADNFRQIRAELKSELERLEAENEELKAENQNLRTENKLLKMKLTEFESLLRETPEEPIITHNKGRPKDTIELIMDLLYQKYCTSNIIKVKSPKKGKQTVGDIIT